MNDTHKTNRTPISSFNKKPIELTNEKFDQQLKNYSLIISAKGVELHKNDSCNQSSQRPILISVLPILFQDTFSQFTTAQINAYHRQIINYKGSLWADNIIYSYLNSISNTEQLPEILITYDYNCIYEKEFLNRFYDQQKFNTRRYYHTKNENYRDYSKIIKVLAYDLLVMVVQKNGFNTDAKPREWYELLNPKLEQKIIVPGLRDYFCNSYYLPFIKKFGQKSVEYLDRNICKRIHPEEMKVLIEQNLAPEIKVFVMPFSYARHIKNMLEYEIVLPDDGEMAIPIQMLVKKEAYVKHNQLLRYLTSKELGKEFAKAGYFSTHPGIQTRFSSYIDYEFISNTRHHLSML